MYTCCVHTVYTRGAEKTVWYSGQAYPSRRRVCLPFGQHSAEPGREPVSGRNLRLYWSFGGNATGTGAGPDQPAGSRTLMRNATFAIALFLAVTVPVVPAAAQSGVAASDLATGENYHVEVGGYLWSPSPSILISSESLGIIG